MRLEIPTPSLILLVGPSGCGKSTFARTHFAHTEVVSSDRWHALRWPDEIARVEVVRAPLPVDRRTEPGPFDVVGDVHGCGDELEALLTTLGYVPNEAGIHHHPSRRVVFVGDLVDRGPRIVDV